MKHSHRELQILLVSLSHSTYFPHQLSCLPHYYTHTQQSVICEEGRKECASYHHKKLAFLCTDITKQ